MKALLACLLSSAIAVVTLPTNAQGSVGLTTEILKASSEGHEGKVLELKARIELLPKPERGDRKLARGLNDAALKLLNADDAIGAAPIFEKAVLADLADVEVINNYGYSLMKANQHELAKGVLFQSISLAPGRTSAWFNLAQVFASLGDKTNSVAAFDVAFLFSQDKEKTKEFLTRFVADPNSSSTLVEAASESLSRGGIREPVATSPPAAAAAVAPAAVVEPQPSVTTPVSAPPVPVVLAASPEDVKPVAPARTSDSSGSTQLIAPLVLALVAGAIFVIVVRRRKMSGLVAGGGGLIVVCVVFVIVASLSTVDGNAVDKKIAAAAPARSVPAPAQVSAPAPVPKPVAGDWGKQLSGVWTYDEKALPDCRGIGPYTYRWANGTEKLTDDSGRVFNHAPQSKRITNSFGDTLALMESRFGSARTDWLVRVVGGGTESQKIEGALPTSREQAAAIMNSPAPMGQFGSRRYTEHKCSVNFDTASAAMQAAQPAIEERFVQTALNNGRSKVFIRLTATNEIFRQAMAQMYFREETAQCKPAVEKMRQFIEQVARFDISAQFEGSNDGSILEMANRTRAELVQSGCWF